MPEYAKITHRFSRNTVTTTVSITGKTPMQKTWRRKGAGMTLDSDKNWDDEPALRDYPQIAEAAMDFHDECCDAL